MMQRIMNILSCDSPPNIALEKCAELIISGVKICRNDISKYVYSPPYDSKDDYLIYNSKWCENKIERVHQLLLNLPGFEPDLVCDCTIEGRCELCDF